MIKPVNRASLNSVPAGTTSFLMSAGVETGSTATEKPTIFRFDL